MKTSLFAKLTIQTAVAIALGLTGLSQAQQWTGSGTTDNWSDSQNWSSGVAPVNNGGATISFFGSNRTTPDLDVNYNVDGLYFGGSTPFIIGSSNSSHLTIQRYLGQNANTNATINTDVVIGSAQNQIYTNSGAGNLFLNGNININNSRFYYFNFGGAIQVNGAITGNGSVLKDYVGIGGNLSLTGANSYTGSTSVAATAFSVTGNAGTIRTSSDYNFRVFSNVFIGDNTSSAANPDRLSDTAPLTLSASRFTFTGSDNTTTTIEETGPITIDGGQSKITINPANSTRQTQLVASNLESINGGTAIILGANLGQASGPGGVQFFPGSPYAIGANTTAKNRIIIPYLTGAIQANGSGSTFLTNTPTRGVRPLDPATEFAQGLAVASTRDNVRETGSATYNVSKTINSLLLNGTGTTTLAPGSVLGVSSGAILGGTDSTNGSSYTGTLTGGIIQFGTRTGYVTDVAHLNSSLDGSQGVVTSGTVDMGGTNTYTGQTFINGQLTITSNAALGSTGSGNETILNTGGSLTLSGGVTTGERLLQRAEGSYNYIGSQNGNNTLNGDLVLEATQSSSQILFAYNQATLTVNGNVTSNQSGSSFGRTSLYLQSGADSSITVNGIISDGTSSIYLDNSNGTSRLTNANTYSSYTQNEGTLYVNNSAGSGTGSGDVSNTGIVGGNGRIDPADGKALYNSGTIAPGDPTIAGGVGTLTIGSAGSENRVYMGTGSKFTLQLGSTSDLLRIYGGLTLGGPVGVEILDAGNAVLGDYNLVTYTTTLNGDFNNLQLTLPVGWSGSLLNDTVAKALVLHLTSGPSVTSVPEASTSAFYILGAAGLWLTMRSRRNAKPDC